MDVLKRLPQSGVTWMRPTSVLSPRFLRFNVTVDF
jgi:hypothetical protein